MYNEMGGGGGGGTNCQSFKIFTLPYVPIDSNHLYKQEMVNEKTFILSHNIWLNTIYLIALKWVQFY